jgi:hypothetical protein
VVVHHASFGEDKEGTLGSFGMSSDVQVYVEANINDEVRGAPINLLEGIGGVRAQGEEIKIPPPLRKGDK